MTLPRSAAALLLLPLFSAPAFADDRAPTAEERTKIETALKAAGYQSWGEIELDDDRAWDVDDARHSDGKEYDLELDKTTLAVTKRDPD